MGSLPISHQNTFEKKKKKKEKKEKKRIFILNKVTSLQLQIFLRSFRRYA